MDDNPDRDFDARIPEAPPKREPLLEVIKQELRDRGYRELEKGRYGEEGGLWESPDPEEGWIDRILPTLEDCFNRESPL